MHLVKLSNVKYNLSKGAIKICKFKNLKMRFLFGINYSVYFKRKDKIKLFKLIFQRSISIIR